MLLCWNSLPEISRSLSRNNKTCVDQNFSSTSEELSWFLLKLNMAWFLTPVFFRSNIVLSFLRLRVKRECTYRDVFLLIFGASSGQSESMAAPKPPLAPVWVVWRFCFSIFFADLVASARKFVLQTPISLSRGGASVYFFVALSKDKDEIFTEFFCHHFLPKYSEIPCFFL